MAINKKSNKKFFAKIGVYREKLESLITLKFRLLILKPFLFDYNINYEDD